MAVNGKRAKTGGRTKGRRNKTTRDVQAFVDAVFAKVDPIKLANELLASEDEKIRATIWTKLMEYRYGKPAQPVTGDGGGPVMHAIQMVNYIERPVRKSIDPRAN